MRTMYPRIIDWLLPGYCELCGLRSAGAALCATCAGDLPRISQPCPGCALPVPAPGLRCGRCLRQPPAWDSCHVPLVYGGPVRKLVLRFKTDGSPGVLDALIDACGSRAAAGSEADATVLVPIPGTRWRNLRRGFNPAELIARRIGAPVDTRLLLRRHGPRQSGLDRRARARNVSGRFVARRSAARRILLVDDVMTSGATLTEVTRVLRRAGAQRVDVFALARTLE